MDARQIEIVDILVNEMGSIIIQIGDRFFTGRIEIPDETQKHCTVIGKEITHFFKAEAIRKTKDQIKSEVMIFTNNISERTIKFNANTEWYSYS